MTYEILIAHLNNNHFYPVAERNGDKISRLVIQAPAIIAESRLLKVRDVIKAYPVKIVHDQKSSSILVSLITKK